MHFIQCLKRGMMSWLYFVFCLWWRRLHCVRWWWSDVVQTVLYLPFLYRWYIGIISLEWWWWLVVMMFSVHDLSSLFSVTGLMALGDMLILVFILHLIGHCWWVFNASISINSHTVVDGWCTHISVIHTPYVRYSTGDGGDMLIVGVFLSLISFSPSSGVLLIGYCLTRADAHDSIPVAVILVQCIWSVMSVCCWWSPVFSAFTSLYFSYSRWWSLAFCGVMSRYLLMAMGWNVHFRCSPSCHTVSEYGHLWSPLIVTVVLFSSVYRPGILKYIIWSMMGNGDRWCTDDRRLSDIRYGIVIDTFFFFFFQSTPVLFFFFLISEHSVLWSHSFFSFSWYLFWLFSFCMMCWTTLYSNSMMVISVHQCTIVPCHMTHTGGKAVVSIHDLYVFLTIFGILMIFYTSHREMVSVCVMHTSPWWYSFHDYSSFCLLYTPGIQCWCILLLMMIHHDVICV